RRVDVDDTVDVPPRTDDLRMDGVLHVAAALTGQDLTLPPQELHTVRRDLFPAPARGFHPDAAAIWVPHRDMTQHEVSEILDSQYARGHGDLFADGLVAL